LYICRNFQNKTENWAGPEATDSNGRTPAMDNTGRNRAEAQLASDLNKNEEKRGTFINRIWDRTQDLLIEANGTNQLSCQTITEVDGLHFLLKGSSKVSACRRRRTRGRAQVEQRFTRGRRARSRELAQKTRVAAVVRKEEERIAGNHRRASSTKTCREGR
jgi:hypothetical protein